MLALGEGGKCVRVLRSVSWQPVPFVDKAEGGKKRRSPETNPGINRVIWAPLSSPAGSLRVRVYFFPSRTRRLWATKRILSLDFAATRLHLPLVSGEGDWRPLADKGRLLCDGV